jgi:GTP cyclohydrolase I
MPARRGPNPAEEAPVSPIPPVVIESIRTLLRWIGENPDREGLRDTPREVATRLRASLSGYGRNIPFDFEPREEERPDRPDIILLRDAPFEMVRETDLARVTGFASFAYLPHLLTAQSSGLEDALGSLARRLQTQEQLTADFARTIWDRLSPIGVAGVMETVHVDRVSGRPAAYLPVATRSTLGCFRDDPDMRSRLAALIGPGRRASDAGIAGPANRG